MLLGISVFISLSYISPLSENSSYKIDLSSKKSLLFFEPNTVHIDDFGKEYTAHINLDSQGNDVSSVQIELKYNPFEIYNLSIIPAKNGLFGNENMFDLTLLEVREQYGRAGIAIERKSNISEVKGIGMVAVVSFSAYPTFSNSSIQFINKSTVLKRDSRKSILSKTFPLTITTINSTNTPTLQRL